jgi:hypothetical protein
MKSLFGLCLALLSVGVAHARLGETEAEMIARFGPPAHRGQHTAHAQGKNWDLGPSLSFKQDDWNIGCDLIDGRCVRVSYQKRGEWTEEQTQLVLSYNSQGGKWTETTKSPSMKKLARSWRRSDGATAGWTSTGGMKMEVPAYERAKQVIEAKAKAEVSKKPKI